MHLQGDFLVQSQTQHDGVYDYFHVRYIFQ